MIGATWHRGARWLAASLAPGLMARRAFLQQAWPNPPATSAAERAWLDSAEPLRFAGGSRGWQWGEQGPLALMLHGWNGRPGQFAPLVATMRAAGYQVVVLAAPGHGPGPRCPSHVLGFSRALLRVAAELPPISALVGHSMGGAACLLALRQGLRAERVISLSAPSSLAQALARQAEALALPANARHRFLQAMDVHLGLPAEAVDVAPLVSKVATPALIVHDHDDRVVPFAEAGRLVAALPRACLLATRGLGHGRGLADAQVHARIESFVREPFAVEDCRRSSLAA